MISRVLWGLQVVSTFGLAVVLLTTGLGLTRPQLVHDVGIAGVLSWLPVALEFQPFPFWARSLVDGFTVRRLDRCRWVLCGVMALIWGAVYWGKHAGFELGNYDVGIYSSVAYNSSIGDWFYSSVQQKNHLGEHFSPVMALFAPLYRLQPDLRWLLLAQLAAYCLTAWPLDRLVRSFGAARRPAAACSCGLTLLWFLYPPMQAAMQTPFHPSSLAAPLILLCLLWWRQQRFVRFSVGMAMLLLFKENLALVLAGVGMTTLAEGRRIRRGVLLLVLSVALVCISTQWLIPWIEGDDYSKFSRLAPFDRLLDKVQYVWGLLSPLGFLPLLHWRQGLVALPAMLQNLASGYQPMLSLRFHYDDLTAPLLFAALPSPLLFWWWPRLAQRRRLPAIAAALLVMAVLVSVPKSPLHSLIKDPPLPVHQQLHRKLVELEEQLPGDAWLLSQHALGPYLHHPLHRPFTARDERCSVAGLAAGSVIVLSDAVNDAGITDLPACLAALQQEPTAEWLDQYQPLQVFRMRVP